MAASLFNPGWERWALYQRGVYQWHYALMDRCGEVWLFNHPLAKPGEIFILGPIQ